MTKKQQKHHWPAPLLSSLQYYFVVFCSPEKVTTKRLWSNCKHFVQILFGYVDMVLGQALQDSIPFVYVLIIIQNKLCTIRGYWILDTHMSMSTWVQRDIYILTTSHIYSIYNFQFSEHFVPSSNIPCYHELTRGLLFAPNNNDNDKCWKMIREWWVWYEND